MAGNRKAIDEERVQGIGGWNLGERKARHGGPVLAASAGTEEIQRSRRFIQKILYMIITKCQEENGGGVEESESRRVSHPPAARRMGHPVRCQALRVCRPPGHKIPSESVHADAGLLLRLDEDFQVRFDVRLVADFLKEERIDVAAGGNEVQIAPNTRLGRVDVAEIVCAIDDPIIFVAGREIEDFLVFRQHDER